MEDRCLNRANGCTASGKTSRKNRKENISVLYSFPHKIGAGRICSTAWHQVHGLSRSGLRVTVISASKARSFDEDVRHLTSLSWRGVRLPTRIVGRYLACQWHDRIVASWLARNSKEIDIVHGWPLGSERTIEVAKTLGIPFALERPNAHTEFAYDAVAQEAKAVGIELPKGHDHRENQRYLSHEKVEYDGASALLCPSDFVERTFRERGFADRKLIRHQYGFDRERCFPTLGELPTNDLGGLKMLYAGVCEPRKGLHRALEAWFESGAYRRGRFQICGEFVPGYREALAEWLEHPSVEVMGHRRDLPEIMRQADVFVLSSVEEGSALVTYEARGSGCVLLVSDSTGAICCDGVNGLLHPTGDVRKLGEQIAMLDSDPKLLGRLRQESLSDYNQLTWDHAGRVLADCYHEILERARSDS